MIERFRLANFKGHVDTTIALGRLTILVGDNGSGKTSVLEALQLHAWLKPGHAISVPRDLLNGGASGPLVVETAETNGGTIAFSLRPELPQHWVLEQTDGSRRTIPMGGYERGQLCLYRFEADAISAPAYSDDLSTRIEQDGKNTAVVLAGLKLERLPTFEVIERSLQRLVPSVKAINVSRARVARPSPSVPGHVEQVIGSQLHFDFQGATQVPAHKASQGTLIILALLTTLYESSRPNLILLDDLEHALHPRAQMELVKFLKELIAQPEFSDLQIVATTHSPYVLDMVDPKDVYAFAVDDAGAVASKRLSNHPEAARSTLTTGQLWSLDPEHSWVLAR